MNFKLLTAIALALALGAAQAQATPIAVPNASFENPTTPTGGDGAPIAGWVFNSQSGNLYGTSLIANSFRSEGAASGNNYAWMFNDVYGKTDTITSAASLGAIQADTVYTLTVAIGNVAGSDAVSNHSPGNVSFSLLANGVAFATEAVPSGTVPDGTFEDFSLTFQTPSTGSLTGESLEIQLASLPTSSLGYGPAFDNVTLDATPVSTPLADPVAVPEPATWLLVLSSGIGLCCLMRRRSRFLVPTAFPLVVVILLSSPSARAVSITVPNGSFETPGNPITSTSNDNLVQSWVFSTSNADTFGTAALNLNVFSTGSADGSRYVFIDNSGKTKETITSASSLGIIAPLTTYTLTVAVGNVKASDGVAFGSPGNVSFSLLANGVAFATQTVSNGTVANGTFEDFTLTYLTPATGSIIGESLTIQLASQNSSGGDYDAAFDNVTLDAIPEPPGAALLAAGGLLLFCVIRRRSRSGIPAVILAFTSFVSINSCEAQVIKSLPLDDQTVYRLKVGTDKVTTLFFPQAITALEGSGLTADAKTPAKMLLSYHAGDRFLSLRALTNPAEATLNVIVNRKVYVLELATDKEPVQSVTFYPADEPPAQTLGQPNLGPSRLLGLLDKAKAYPLLAEQYPEMISQIDKAEPFSQSLYEGFHVVLTKVLRFDAEDALIFQVEFVNETDRPIVYVPQSLAVRVGPNVYWSALSDASGIIPGGTRNPQTGQIDPGHSHGYFVICGTPHGERNHLSVQNPFNVLVFRQENP